MAQIKSLKKIKRNFFPDQSVILSPALSKHFPSDSTFSYSPSSGGYVVISLDCFDNVSLMVRSSASPKNGCFIASIKLHLFFSCCCLQDLFIPLCLYLNWIFIAAPHMTGALRGGHFHINKSYCPSLHERKHLRSHVVSSD